MTAEPAPLTPQSEASAIALVAVRFLVEALHDAEPRVQRDEPDSVHAMRTIVRRIRSVLASFRQVFDKQVIDDLRGRLEKLGTALGEARDLEVRANRAEHALAALRHEFQDASARTRLVDGSRTEYRHARDRVLAFLKEPDYLQLLDALDDFVDSPSLGPRAAEEGSTALTRSIEKDAKRALKRAGTSRTADDWSKNLPALHEVRKAARRLRYTSDALTRAAPDIFGSDFAGVAEAAERVQDALGDHRDSVLFTDYLRFEESRAHVAGEKTFLYGSLRGRSEADAETALSDLDAALDELRRNAKKL
jgi:CHAD domain-containing protein